jgi:hypothetical protein
MTRGIQDVEVVIYPRLSLGPALTSQRKGGA